jgi:hypothetical protein
LRLKALFPQDHHVIPLPEAAPIHSLDTLFRRHVAGHF